MKRFLLLFMTAAMVLTLCSCGLFKKEEDPNLPPEAPKTDPVFQDPSEPVPEIPPTIPENIDPATLNRDDGIPYKMAVIGESSVVSTTKEGFRDLMYFDDEHDMTGTTYYVSSFAIQVAHDSGFSLQTIQLRDKYGMELFGPYIPENYVFFAREYRSQIPLDTVIQQKADLFATGYPFFSPDECDTVVTVVVCGIEPIDLDELTVRIGGVDYASKAETSRTVRVNSQISEFNTVPRIVTGCALLKIGQSYYIHNANQLTGGDDGETQFARPLHMQNLTSPFQETGDLSKASFAYFDLTKPDGLSFQQVTLPEGAAYDYQMRVNGPVYNDMWLGITCQPGQIDQIRMSMLQKPGLYLIGDYPTILVNG